MTTYPTADDVFGSSSHFLSPSHISPMKSSSRQGLHGHRSTASLRSSSHAMEDVGANGRHHSLAHELAVALMPEPSAGSKLLAEEFGIEYDEGAEGIDEDDQDIPRAPSFADEAAAQTANDSIQNDSPLSILTPSAYDQSPFSSPSAHRPSKPSEQDAMEVLAQNLSSTDKFLSHLRRLDLDTGSSTSQPALETLASDIIRRINETTRDREGQVRELLEYEREFRKIAGEVGGNDVLGQLDELTDLGDLLDQKPAEISQPETRTLDPVVEEPPPSAITAISYGEWEVDPDLRGLEEDEEDAYTNVMSPIKDSFPPPPIIGIPTPANTIPQLADLRTFTTSLVSSLTVISEHAQVNGAATTEAGRKIRALKNKLGGWRTDQDNAERSRVKIERWEAGIADKDVQDGTPSRSRPSKREDGRKLVDMHLRAFETALKEAGLKTQAIMAK